MPELSDEIRKEMEEAGFKEKEINRVPVCFDVFDKDGSGNIDAEELREAMQAFGCDVSDNSAKKMLEETDTDNDGTVSFEEFCRMLVKKRKQKSVRKDKLRQAFKCFDEDESGYLEREELKNVLTSMGIDPISEEEVDNFLDIGDCDGDGKLSVEEFVRVLTMDMDKMIDGEEEAEE